ncbi:MAG: hypothetical protein ACLR6J_06295 [Parabacteroides merdae]
MDRETLYKFFEGAASYEEEVRIRQWMEHSPENRREFLKERKIFDSMLLLGDEKTIEEKMRHKSWSLASSLGTTFFFKKYPFQPEPLFVIIPQSWKPAIIAPSKKDREYFKILS